MPKYKIEPSSYKWIEKSGKRKRVLSRSLFAAFEPAILGLGDITAPSTPVDAIAVIFDLGGFTNFCKQIEPHLSVPSFLNSFLGWLFEQLRDVMQENDHDKDSVTLWCPLPYFVKFLGDGLLVLWDSSATGAIGHRNIIVSCCEICGSYTTKFLPSLRTRIVEPPNQLRCGIARGTAFPVGDGNDYVGSCINMAARLQKLPGISFAFNRRGFDLEADNCSNFFKNDTIITEVAIRGIGDHELIGIRKREFEALDATDKKIFRTTG